VTGRWDLGVDLSQETSFRIYHIESCLALQSKRRGGVGFAQRWVQVCIGVYILAVDRGAHRLSIDLVIGK
jgi:hypothetical protein